MAQQRRCATTILASVVCKADYCFSASFRHLRPPSCRPILYHGWEMCGSLPRQCISAIGHPVLSRGTRYTGTQGVAFCQRAHYHTSRSGGAPARCLIAVLQPDNRLQDHPQASAIGAATSRGHVESSAPSLLCRTGHDMIHPTGQQYQQCPVIPARSVLTNMSHLSVPHSY